MPTYQYECDACEHAFEHMQSMLDKKLRKCPECGKFKLSRLIGTGGGIIFKGSGFYETDYKRSGEKKESSSGDSKDVSKEGTKKTETKSKEKPTKKTTQKKDK